MSFKKLRVSAVAGAAAVSLSLAAAPAASAQSLQLPAVGSSAQGGIGQMLGLSADAAWNQRQALLQQFKALNNPLAANVLGQAVDNVLNGLFPGLVERKNAEIRAEQERIEREHAAEVARQQEAARAAAAAAAAQQAGIDRGSCPLDADVCVDIDKDLSWLQDDNGNITYVARWISSGARTPELATPRGTFRVQYKVKDEVSREFGNAPMPYSIYFTNNGHAFHEGSPAYDSHGCIHLEHQDAIAYWNDLKVGDKVVIF